MVLSHKKLASWYLQLAQSQEAGLTLAESLRISAGPPAADLQAMAERIETGASVDDLFRTPPPWLPQADRYFISSAATSGRLSQTLHNLAQHHIDIGNHLSKVSLALLYPIGMLNFACILLPFNKYASFDEGLSFDWVGYLYAVFPALGILWGGLCIIFLLVKYQSPLIPMMMQCLPGLRGYYRHKLIANFSYGLGVFLDAGLPINQSWAGAALISNDGKMKKVASTVQQVINRGSAPSETLAQFPIFPQDFIALYTAGERTGKLDSNLITISQSYQKKAAYKLTLTAIIYPSIVFLMIAGFMAYHIFAMYASYFKAITSLAE